MLLTYPHTPKLVDRPLWMLLYGIFNERNSTNLTESPIVFHFDSFEGIRIIHKQSCKK